MRIVLVSISMYIKTGLVITVFLIEVLIFLLFLLSENSIFLKNNFSLHFKYVKGEFYRKWSPIHLMALDKLKSSDVLKYKKSILECLYNYYRINIKSIDYRDTILLLKSNIEDSLDKIYYLSNFKRYGVLCKLILEIIKFINKDILLKIVSTSDISLVRKDLHLQNIILDNMSNKCYSIDLDDVSVGEYYSDLWNLYINNKDIYHELKNMMSSIPGDPFDLKVRVYEVLDVIVSIPKLFYSKYYNNISHNFDVSLARKVSYLETLL